ncbi:putative diaminopropionate ammonia-lyase [Escherichia coli]|uniref:Putative diaminopropionate ammonia-lyase n=1 Tax=Escherichia coli TaxID=562 RepID=A0A376MHD1_ECOLX|nr:putative diaminopropionate ammonia-lyase [Escherichia coli]
MAGLACGEPNPLGWEILRNCATQFISCQDSVAALGMRVLGNPYGNDRASSPVNPALSVWAFSQRFIITRNVKA